jgi:Leucine-rich repeat (LRR) protein
MAHVSSSTSSKSVRTPLPSSAHTDTAYLAHLQGWSQRTASPRPQQAVQRIEKWLAAADLSQTLDLTDCELIDCPPLPNHARKMNLSFNPDLAQLPHALPDALEDLIAMFCSLTSLPHDWPHGLRELNVVGNQIPSLPDTLPASLRKLWAANNRIAEVLFHRLPIGLEQLGVGNNRIFEVHTAHLPRLSLKLLVLVDNHLTPECEQALRHISAAPDYQGPTIRIGFSGERFDFFEELPAGRAKDAGETPIVRADPLRHLIREQLAIDPRGVLSYADQHRTIVQPLYPPVQSTPFSTLASLPYHSTPDSDHKPWS